MIIIWTLSCSILVRLLTIRMALSRSFQGMVMIESLQSKKRNGKELQWTPGELWFKMAVFWSNFRSKDQFVQLELHRREIIYVPDEAKKDKDVYFITKSKIVK